MSIEKARNYLKKFGKDGDIKELAVSAATVELAANALNVTPAEIAKSLAFKATDATEEVAAILILTSGDVKVDNAKFKQQFGYKACMLTPDEVLRVVGHAVGGVCPFGIPEDVKVYMDMSLKRFEYVYPACGESNAVIKLSLVELERLSGSCGWLDVCKS